MKIGKCIKTDTATREPGESYLTIIEYWIPELLSNSLLFILPFIADAYFVAQLNSTSTYSALGVSNTLLHSLIKLSEAMMIASVVVMGRYNGAGQYKKCGKALGDTFWSTVILGIIQFGIVFFLASIFFDWIGTSKELAQIGIPFLKIQSFAVLLCFVFQAFLGFFRSVKNTRTPFYITTGGIVLFLFLDYALILGKMGFPKMGLLGSAISSLARFGFVTIAAICYLLLSKRYRFYFSQAFYRSFNVKNMLHLVTLSIPVMLDKTALTISYIWMCKMMAPLGTYSIAAMDVLKILERFALLPATAFAQVVTFLVSNNLGANNPDGARNNIKKVLLLATVLASISLIFMCINAKWLIGAFDHECTFTQLASRSLPILGPIIIFDLVQLILAGALRGAGDVKTVMWTRILSCGLLYIPLSRLTHYLPIESELIKFTLIYGFFYLNTAVIGLVFFIRIRGNAWLNKNI